MKNLQNLGKTLSKKEQKSINGGARITRCEACGGFPVGNGKCLGTQQVHCCLSGQCE